MRYILNVGLNVARGAAKITPLAVVEHLTAEGLRPQLLDVRKSATEKTAIVAIEPLRGKGRLSSADRSRGAVYAACLPLMQEAIALYDTKLDRGWIIGPHADRWGAFDKAQFLMPEEV